MWEVEGRERLKRVERVGSRGDRDDNGGEK